MSSIDWRLPTGLAVLLVSAYALVIAGNILLGVVGATLVFLVGWLLGHAGESDAIPTLGRRREAVASVVTLVALAYGVVFGQTIWVGVFVGILAFGVAFLHAAIAQSQYSPSLGRNRKIAVSVLSLLVMAYALLIVGQLLVGLVAVGLLWLAAWLTSPGGPLVDGT